MGMARSGLMCKRRGAVWACLLIMGTAFPGCSHGDGTVGDTSHDIADTGRLEVRGEGRTDTLISDVGYPDGRIPSDGFDLGLEWQPAEVKDGILPDWKPEEGELGWPCFGPGDCAEPWCEFHMGEQYCTKTCVTECPQGWACRPVQSGTDEVNICKSLFPRLCHPCKVSDWCGTGHKCVQHADIVGAFCGGKCGDGVECPGGYECKSVKTVDGDDLKQCVRTGGECQCSEYAMANNLETNCARLSEWGTCEGTRMCSPEGLTDCSAPLPADEACDGADNDCDGSVDEKWEECDDGDQCTEDKCDSGACANDDLTGTACYDANVCTLDDHCEAGECVGAPLNCDDENTCTDDWCDPEKEEPCQHTANDSNPCDDGNYCTSGDHCVEGECQHETITDDPEKCPTCGNKMCEFPETYLTCALDCGWCGDGI